MGGQGSNANEKHKGTVILDQLKRPRATADMILDQLKRSSNGTPTLSPATSPPPPVTDDQRRRSEQLLYVQELRQEDMTRKYYLLEKSWGRAWMLFRTRKWAYTHAFWDLTFLLPLHYRGRVTSTRPYHQQQTGSIQWLA